MIQELKKLKKARALVAGGWSGPLVEPFCVVRAPGIRLNPNYRKPGTDSWMVMWLPCATHWTLDVSHEALTHYSVWGALEATGADEWWDTMNQVLGADEHLRQWLNEPSRKLGEVLGLFDRTIIRAKRGDA